MSDWGKDVTQDRVIQITPVHEGVIVTIERAGRGCAQRVSALNVAHETDACPQGCACA
jgi:hypothetical protein